MVEYSKPFSKKIQANVDPILALKRTILIKPEEEKVMILVPLEQAPKAVKIDEFQEEIKDFIY